MAKGKHTKVKQEARSKWKLGAGVLCLVLLCGLGVLYHLYTSGQIDVALTASLSSPESADTSSNSTASNSALSGSTSSSTLSGSTSSSTSSAHSASTAGIDIAGKTEAAKKRTEAEIAKEKERAEAEAAAKKEAQEAAKDFSEHVNSAALIEKISEGAAASIFSMNEKRSAPDVTSDQLAAIQAAADAIAEAGYTYTAVFLDINSGQGIAINADEAVYTASSFKAPLVGFLLENDLASEWESHNMEASILHSDNDAFEALASGHMDGTYRAWLDEHLITYDEWSPWYPHASARSMAACWADIYHYTQTDTANAAWFKDLLANTNISFIRNALEGEDVQVWNKGGWLSDPEYNAVADCGIIEAGGRSYLMAILTNQPSWGETQERVQNLARALWDCKDKLA